jgi:hypothetical protein
MSKRITKLPDGSAFMTATIMSKEEAMALPPHKRPLNYRISQNMYMAVWSAIGDAMHSSPEMAANIVADLCLKIADEVESHKASDVDTKDFTKWISVDTALPPEGRIVETKTSGNGADIGGGYFIKRIYKDGKWNDVDEISIKPYDGFIWNSPGPTHWHY